MGKTLFIPLVEQVASFFFLIRSRRFGKTLLLNMLDAYYDINNADRFNCSSVDSTPGRLEESFEEHCAFCFRQFTDRYEHLFRPGFREELDKCRNASSRLQYPMKLLLTK